MVKAWAAAFVDEYEQNFADKIDWDAKPHSLWIEEVKDGWTFRLGIWYWPAENGRPELFEISFSKSNFPLLTKKTKLIKRFRMWGYKGQECKAKFNKGTQIKRGDWYYENFNTR